MLPPITVVAVEESNYPTAAAIATEMRCKLAISANFAQDMLQKQHESHLPAADAANDLSAAVLSDRLRLRSALNDRLAATIHNLRWQQLHLNATAHTQQSTFKTNNTHRNSLMLYNRVPFHHN